MNDDLTKTFQLCIDPTQLTYNILWFREWDDEYNDEDPDPKIVQAFIDNFDGDRDVTRDMVILAGLDDEPFDHDFVTDYIDYEQIKALRKKVICWLLPFTP